MCTAPFPRMLLVPVVVFAFEGVATLQFSIAFKQIDGLVASLLFWCWLSRDHHYIAPLFAPCLSCTLLVTPPRLPMQIRFCFEASRLWHVFLLPLRQLYHCMLTTAHVPGKIPPTSRSHSHVALPYPFFRNPTSSAPLLELNGDAVGEGWARDPVAAGGALPRPSQLAPRGQEVSSLLYHHAAALLFLCRRWCR